MAVRRQDGVLAVVLADEITTDMQQGIIPAMQVRGFVEEVTRLDQPDAFLEHLVLHEAAHLLLPPGTTETECDEWAFARLTGSMHVESS